MNKIMNKKISRFIILILIISFICVGCSDDTKNKTAKTDENVLHCKRKEEDSSVIEITDKHQQKG